MVWAEDIESASSALERQNCQILLLDIDDSKDLSRMKGLLKKHADVPLIVLTSLVEPFWHQILLREGAQDFLVLGQFDAALLSRSLSYTLERHAALRDLRESEGRFRSMVERNADGIVIVDRDQRVQFMNPAAESLLGFRASELIGHVFEVPLTKNLSQSQTEVTLTHKNGGPVPAEFRFVAIEWEGERAYMLSLRDVSERREMEEAHGRLVAILEETSDFVAIADLKGRFLWVNRAGRLLVGLKPGEPANKYLLKDVVPATTFRLLENEGLPSAREKGIWQQEAAVLYKGIKEIPVSMQIQAHKSIDGVVKYYSTVSRDISERRAAADKLENQTRILRSILDSMGDGVIVADEQGTFLHWNPEAEHLVGAGPKASMPSRWMADYGLLKPDTGKPFPFDEMPLYRAILGEASDQVEMLSRRADGEELILSATGRALKDKAGSLKGGVVVFRDITEAKLASEQLTHYSKALEHKNQELQDFAYVASHDLKAPLRAISQISQWLAEDLGEDLPEESARLLELLHSRVHRMQGLLDDLLRYARAGHQDVPVETVDTALLVNEIADLMGLLPQFKIRTDDSLPVFDTGRGPLEQVLRNLLGNAAKHHDQEQGELSVSCSKVKNEGIEFFNFIVEDDGPGIPPEFHSRVFKMFQTLKPRDTVDGSGMGLALVQKIIHSCGGSIELQSDGRGTRISFTWPVQWNPEA
ncbi:MAG: PAS domain S-box protein [Planctomycetota bacterium]|nr:PAS domain S-box protein [Planctomycetota bacterium]